MIILKTQKHKRAYNNIKYCVWYEVGGLINTIQDFGEDSDEGKSAIKTLVDLPALEDYLYRCAISTEYGPGFTRDDPNQKYIKFLGKEFVMAAIRYWLSLDSDVRYYTDKYKEA